MANINFMPEDYVEKCNSSKTNLLYLVLLLVVMLLVGATFMTIKVRQRSLDKQQEFVNMKISQAQQSIKQFEEMRSRKLRMEKTVLMTTKLLEPVPRSVILASLTNNLPGGVSLLQLDLEEKKKTIKIAAQAVSNYEAKSGAKPASVTKEIVSTNIGIRGVATSDIGVASYIANLSTSILFDDVDLVESKEYEIEEVKFREFKLTARLKDGIHVTAADIGKIKALHEGSGAF